jgi:peptidoglycan/LPS O-acetylase OafA/YrhL
VAGFQLVDHKLRDNFTQSVGFAILAAGFAAILLTAVLTDSERTWLQTWLRWKPLTRFGKYAYGTYVFHVPIFYFVNRLSYHLPVALQGSLWFGYLSVLVKFAISFCAASLSYNFFEKKFLLLKGRFEPEYNLAETPTSVTPYSSNAYLSGG